MARNETPDLLESMFSAPAKPEPKPVSKKKATQKSSSTRKTSKPKPKTKPKPEPLPPEPPIRCTHYVSRQMTSRMHSVQGLLLGQTTMKKRDLSNSSLVEAALRFAFADLDKNGVNSAFVKMLEQIAQQQKGSKTQ